MACGVPVVASAQASSALEAQPGRDLLVAETAEGFAAEIVELLEGQARRTLLGVAGRQYVLRQHQWDQIAADREQYYCAMRLQANHLAPINAEGGRS
jgi:glycosyltransferase involved in cell wall biosynthesis